MDQTLGKRIAQNRKKMGLTQEQLAEKLSVTAQAVSKWENDLSCPDINMLPRLAELFDTTTDALLGRETVYEAEVIGNAVPQREESEAEKGGWEFHWDGGRKGTLVFAIYVLLVGGLLFTARYLNWDVGFWGIVWPSAMLVSGLYAMVKTPCFTNVICALLGGYLLIDNLGVFDISLDKGLIFPALILVFGISLLMDGLRKPKGKRFHIHKKGDMSHSTRKHFRQEGESFNCGIRFGEVSHSITLPRLRDGEASVSFGEMTLDLTGCGEITERCQVDVRVSFGELNLKVPRRYRVECAAGTAFGDISTYGHCDENTKATITLIGNVSFGELEIYYV